MHYLFSILSALSSSVTSILGKYSFNIGASPSQILFLRFLFSFIISGIIFIFMGYKFNIKKFLLYSLLGIVNYGIAAYSFFIGLQFLNPAYATVVYFTNPIFVSYFQHKLTKRKINLLNATAVGLSFAGVVIANMGERAFENNESIVFGTFMVLFSSFINAVFIVSVGEYIKQDNSHPFENVFYTFTGVFIYYFIFTIITNEIFLINRTYLLSGFILAILATFVPLTLNYFALKKLQSHTLALIMPLELLFASILSAIFLDEQFNTLKVLGLILVGIAPIVDISGIENE